ncbi:uncharacterized protein EV420DRAFT_1545203 [Desarmillaria tabescens]|uniref:F-box domain-containing protein n=1 Tax=Armillaria tabescens TaxID=1929756 RepID=A0AA39KC30_ARMTA|nr:uncharacterized protein EV420DRAFT_1545203 [Desarmillaria tabescens]KAK0458365.1 hypothetical protein EV420DRAFT_1545203 [Desarmillaria tabescens]
MSHSCPNCHMTCDGSSSFHLAPDPSIIALLHSNQPPSASMEATLRAGSNRISELDSLIPELERKLKSLVQERNLLEWMTRHSRIILNPVRRLPEGVLHKIFRHCVSDSTTSRSSFHPDSHPWILVNVCRMWRQTALSFPLLWTQVHFNMSMIPKSVRARGRLSKESPHDDFISYEYFMKRFHLQLQRSAGIPLDISFICDVNMTNDESSVTSLCNDPVTNEGISYLWPFISSSYRWKRLLISLSGLTLEPFSFIQHSISALETLEIVEGLTTSSYHQVQLLSATNLRNLIINNVDDNSCWQDLQLPWSKLTTLTLRGITTSHLNASQIVQVLCRMSSLESLSFTSQISSWDARKYPHATPVILPKITRLSYIIVQSFTGETILGSQSFDGILSLVVLPSLKQLNILYKDSHYTTDANDGIVSMLRRSSCALKTLNFSWGPMICDPLHLLQCGSCSSLEEISIFWVPVDSIRDIISHLHANDHIRDLSHAVASESVALFLPGLRSMEIDLSSPSLSAEENESVENCIMLFLESREAGGAALERLYIHVQMEYVMSESFERRLLALRERGLRFYMSRYDHNDPRSF